MVAVAFFHSDDSRNVLRIQVKTTAKDFFKTDKETSLQEALDIIKSQYVDKVNTDSLQTGAIQEMMSELDPHSVYFPPFN